MSGLYIEGSGYEVMPGVIVEKGTILYPKNSKKGRMQRIAFYWAYSYVGAIRNYDSAVRAFKKISYPDSQLFYPSPFGYVTSQQAIIDDIKGFADTVREASVWFPKNGWVFDTTKKCGVVQSGGAINKYYMFAVEMQFRQVNNQGVAACTNDSWSFYVDTKLRKFYQIKEWLDGRVRRLQAENVGGTPTLTYDYNNINVIPWPPITPGKEGCINPVTVQSGCAAKASA